MAFRNVTGIIREEKLKDVLKALQEHGVPGASITEVKGYGEYINHYAPNALAQRVKLEVIVDSGRANDVAELVLEACSTGLEGDGIVAVHNVDTLFRVRDKKPL
jgi:nitrogen regulatory protein PII